MNWKQVLLLIRVLILVGVFSFLSFRRGYKRGQNNPVIPQSDTVVVVDTVIYDHPVPEYHYIEKPVYIAVVDSQIVHIHDTTYIALNREIKGYSSEDYKLEVSGIYPELDWIEVYPKTTTITNYVDRNVLPSWTLSFYGEVGFQEVGTPFHARAGLMYEKKIFDGFNYFLHTGYDYNTHWYLGGGLKLILSHE